jgi:hypothetical protein
VCRLKEDGPSALLAGLAAIAALASMDAQADPAAVEVVRHQPITLLPSTCLIFWQPAQRAKEALERGPPQSTQISHLRLWGNLWAV